MQENSKTRDLLIKHLKKYPKAGPEDIFKYLYQSSYGCEHLVSSYETALENIIKEYKTTPCKTPTDVEELDGKYSRVPLSYLDRGLGTDTFAKLLMLSAKSEIDAKEKLLKKLDVANELVCKNKLPFEKQEFEDKLKLWAQGGYQAIHHSLAFKQEYTPSYRLIANKYMPYLPLFSKIDSMKKQDRVLVAIEGKSASGKTTLSKILSEIYDCTVFHMDDFFLQEHQRTEDRLLEIGGNIDYERFLEEVLNPLKNGQSVKYRKFNCHTMTMEKAVAIEPERINIVEGVYSMHPILAEHYDLSVFMDISDKTQKSRILKRNSKEMAKRFFDQWIPMENRYFLKTNIKDRCNLHLFFNE